MKKFRYFILVLAGVAAMMLGGCKDKEKYDESAFQDDLEPLSEDEVEAMDQNGDDEMAVADESDLSPWDMPRFPGSRRYTDCTVLFCRSFCLLYFPLQDNLSSELMRHLLPL